MGDVVREGKTPEQWECSKCQGRHRRCLLHDSSITVSVPARPEHGKFEIASVNDIPELLTWARELSAYRELPDLSILISLGVCPLPMLTALSSELYRLFQLWQSSGEMKIVDGGHYDQPAFYISAMQLIAAEEAKLRAFRSRSQDGRTRKV